MSRLRLYLYKVNWSPHMTAIRAFNMKDADKRIRKAFPGCKGNFFTQYGRKS